jgi:hypothetical protein
MRTVFRSSVLEKGGNDSVFVTCNDAQSSDLDRSVPFDAVPPGRERITLHVSEAPSPRRTQVGPCPFCPHARPGSRNAPPMMRGGSGRRARRPPHDPDTARARARPPAPASAHVPSSAFIYARAIHAPPRRPPPLVRRTGGAVPRTAVHGMGGETSNPSRRRRRRRRRPDRLLLLHGCQRTWRDGLIFPWMPMGCAAVVGVIMIMVEEDVRLGRVRSLSFRTAAEKRGAA